MLRCPILLLVAFALMLAATNDSYARNPPVSAAVTRSAPAVAPSGEVPDTCRIGIYVLSLYDLDFPNNQYATEFWMWLLTTSDSLEPMKTVELTNSKSYTFDNASEEKKGDVTWASQRVKATMRMNWDVRDFPFDRQTLRIVIEDADNDASALVYLPDTANSKLDSNLALDGWRMSKLTLRRELSRYATTYGDPELKGSSVYATVAAYVTLKREGLGLFFKLFTGVYVAFSITMMTFFFEKAEIESRFSLLVGALFAAVTNKYIVDSYLPLSVGFALVDKVHVITFIYILMSFGASVLTMHFQKRRMNIDGRGEKIAARIDRVSFWTLFLSYIAINAWYLATAVGE